MMGRPGSQPEQGPKHALLDWLGMLISIVISATVAGGIMWALVMWRRGDALLLRILLREMGLELSPSEAGVFAFTAGAAIGAIAAIVAWRRHRF